MTPKRDTKTMYQIQKLQNMHQSSLFHQLLKRLIQFTISFSVFSFLILHPSSSPFFRSLIIHLSAFSSQLSAIATDKNYIFLLCNGILVFIAKYSSRAVDTCPPPLPETSPDNDVYYKAYRQSMHSSKEKSVLVENVATNEDENEYRSEGNEVMLEDYVEVKHVMYQITDGALREDGISDDDDDDDDDDKEYKKETSDYWSFKEKEEEEEDEVEPPKKELAEQQEEETIAKMSTEELNRKFDDFIRKMKEEIRIEAQQQLIMV